MLTSGVFPGAVLVPGTSNLYTHAAFSGLVLAKVPSVAAAVSLGGIMLRNPSSGEYVGAVGTDVKHLLSRTASRLGQQVFPWKDWDSPVTTESLIRLYSVVIERAKDQSGVTKKRVSPSSFAAALDNRVAGDGWLTIQQAEAANAVFMAIVTKADFGWFRTQCFTSPNNDGAAGSVTQSWLHPGLPYTEEKSSVGYMGRFLDIGLLKDILVKEQSAMVPSEPSDLVSHFKTAFDEAIVRVDKSARVRIPLIATWRRPRRVRTDPAVLSIGLYDPVRSLYNTTYGTSNNVPSSYESYLLANPPSGVTVRSAAGDIFMNPVIPTDLHPQFFSDVAVNTPDVASAPANLGNTLLDVAGEMCLALAISEEGVLRRPLGLPSYGARVPYSQCLTAQYEFEHWTAGSKAQEQSRINAAYSANLALPVGSQNANMPKPTTSGCSVSSEIWRTLLSSERMTGSASDFFSFVTAVNTRALQLAEQGVS